MKKFLFLVIVAIVTVTNAQTIPAATDSISWETLKALAKGDTTLAILDSTAAKQAIEFAAEGPYGQAVHLKACTLKQVIVITGVKSRTGKVENQDLLVYVDSNGDTKYALAPKGKTVATSEGVTTARGDQKKSKYR